MIDERKIKKLIGMGASRWSKGGRDRLYLNESYKKLLNLKISKYNSGNISSAYMGDEQISNRKAADIISFSKDTYIDLITDEVVVNRDNITKVEEFKELIKKTIEAL